MIIADQSSSSEKCQLLLPRLLSISDQVHVQLIDLHRNILHTCCKIQTLNIETYL